MIHEGQASEHSVERQNRTLRSLTVEGTQRLEPDTVTSYVRARIGMPYTTDTIDQMLRDLFATELFADVSIRGMETGDLVVSIRENPVIRRVIIEGNKHLKSEKIEHEIKLAPRQILSSSKVRSDVARILDLYRRHGRKAATVEPKMVHLDQNSIDLVIEISEGVKSPFSQINIIGKEAFSDKREEFSSKGVKEKASRSEVRLSEGDAFDKFSARDRIRSLGYFSEDIRSDEAIKENDRIVLSSKASRDTPEELTLSQGFSSIEQFILQSSLSQRNFRGKGQPLSARGDEETGGRDYYLKHIEHESATALGIRPALPSSLMAATKVLVENYVKRKTSSSEIGFIKGKVIENSDKSEKNSLSVEVSDVIRMDYYWSFESNLLDKILRWDRINEIQAILIAGKYICFKDAGEKKAFLEDALRTALDPVFEEAEYPLNLREGFLQRLADELLSRDTALHQAPWAAKVVKGMTNQHPARLPQVEQALPPSPPVLWRERSKTVSDPTTNNERLQNASEFLEEVYGDWQGSLTRGWIRQHDNPLFQALYRQHGKELHPNFEFATPHEDTARLLNAGPEAISEHLGKFRGEDALKEAARLRMAKSRQR